MPAWTGREVDNAKGIVKENKKYFVVDSNQIGSLVIGGIDGHYSYEVSYPPQPDPYAYPPRNNNSYPVF